MPDFRQFIRRAMCAAVIAGLLAIVPSAMAQKTAPPGCASDDSYARALCLYRSGDLAGAAKLFSAIAEGEEPSPEVVRAHYFLARIEMRQKRWSDASNRLIRIYTMSRPFYDEWNCDFLLGECRRAMGED